MFLEGKGFFSIRQLVYTSDFSVDGSYSQYQHETKRQRTAYTRHQALELEKVGGPAEPWCLGPPLSLGPSAWSVLVVH